MTSFDELLCILTYGRSGAPANFDSAVAESDQLIHVLSIVTGMDDSAIKSMLSGFYKINRRENTRKWIRANPDKVSAHNRQAREKMKRERPELVGKRQREWKLKNLEHVKERDKAYGMMYRSTHVDELKAKRLREKPRRHIWVEKYHASEKGQLTIRWISYRRRGLAGRPFMLNKRFDDAALHHIEEGIGIWIPKALHQGIHHSLIKQENMVAINEAAARWLDENFSNGGNIK